jgi:hypothetical protein
VPCAPEIVGAEVKLMVPGHEHVGRDPVEDFDNVQALVEARQDRRRDRVTGMDQQRVALGPLCARNGGEFGMATTPVLRGHAVEVIHKDERHATGCGVRHRLRKEFGGGENSDEAEFARRKDRFTPVQFHDTTPPDPLLIATIERVVEG